MARVLLVEDDGGIAGMLQLELEGAGHVVEVAPTLAAARTSLARRDPELVLLDLNLPDGSGLDLCREIRAQSTMPILILTARQGEVDRIVGLELGADDYVVKPFSPREVLARIAAILRRQGWNSSRPPSARLLHRGGLLLDMDRCEVFVHGQPVHLTRTELRLLETLARRPGRVYGRQQLIDLVWEGAFIQDRVVDSVISRLRRKLGTSESGRPFIRTVHGIGYALDLES